MLKRGVTPLLMTVILIGFAVSVTAVVMIWGTSYVKDIQEKQGGFASTKLSCSTDIQIAVDNAQVSGSSASVTVENLRQNIDSFYFIFRGGSGQDNVESLDMLYEGDLKTYNINFNSGFTGQVEEVDVIPRIKVASGVYESCSGQHEVYEF